MLVRLVRSRFRTDVPLVRQLVATFSTRNGDVPLPKDALADKSRSDNLMRSQVTHEMEHLDPWSRKLYPTNQATLPAEIDPHPRPIRPRIDPRETSIILFPGQGVQHVGMGEKIIDSPNVSQMFEIAKSILGYDLLDLCLNGPQSTLDRTEYCQPALLVTSLGAVEKLRAENPSAIEHCVGAGGFSVGEFAALVFAGSITYENALRLVKIRAEAMQAASEMSSSGMMRVIFGADARVNFACNAAVEHCIRKGIYEEHAVCTVANYLFPHCKVLGGHLEALRFIETNKADFGIKNCKMLPVSGAFHTKLMRPAEKVFAEALKKVEVRDPLIPIYSNIDGRPYRSEMQVREKLSKQICAPVQFEQMAHTMFQRPTNEFFPFTFECGPGSSMLAMLDKINSKARRQAINIKA